MTLLESYGQPESIWASLRASIAIEASPESFEASAGDGASFVASQATTPLAAGTAMQAATTRPNACANAR